MRALLCLLFLALAALFGSFAWPHLNQGTDEYRLGAGLSGAALAAAAWALLAIWPSPAIRMVAIVFLILSAAAFFPPWLALSDTATTFFYGLLALALMGVTAVRGLRGAERRRRIRFVGITLILACLAAAAIGGATAGRGIGMAVLFTGAAVLICRTIPPERR